MQKIQLTKGDFTLHQCTNQVGYIFLDNYNPLEMIEQILKNQEDGDKWREYKKDEGKEWDSDIVYELIRIEQRLKRRIEELIEIKPPGLGVMIREELQKILNSKKGEKQ